MIPLVLNSFLAEGGMPHAYYEHGDVIEYGDYVERGEYGEYGDNGKPIVKQKIRHLPNLMFAVCVRQCHHSKQKRRDSQKADGKRQFGNM